MPSFFSGESSVVPSNHVDFVLIITIEKEIDSERVNFFRMNLGISIALSQ